MANEIIDANNYHDQTKYINARVQLYEAIPFCSGNFYAYRIDSYNKITHKNSERERKKS